MKQEPLFLFERDDDPTWNTTFLRCDPGEAVAGLQVCHGEVSCAVFLGVRDARRLARWLLEWAAPLSEKG